MAQSQKHAESGQPGMESACAGLASTTGTLPLHIERHYTVGDLATRWNLSLDTIRRLFENEPGVLVLGESSGKGGKRRYTTLRVPESVAARVHRRLSKV